MTNTSVPNRRAFTRIHSDKLATLTIAGTVHACQLLDISLKGALLQLTGTWRPEVDQNAELNVQLDGEESPHIHMEGSVTHVEGDHVGLQCLHIPLEDAQTLRRLVELNLGDETLLSRELRALIKGL